MSDEFQSLKPKRNEPPDAYQAFLDYVNMGTERSLRLLTAKYKERSADKADTIPSDNFTTLAKWSTRYGWQERVKAYIEELAQINASVQREEMEKFQERVWKDYNRLAKKIEDMIDTVEQQKITRRQRVPDPNNPSGEIEVIRMKVNVHDLQVLVNTFGQLGKDLRAQLGLPTKIAATDPTGEKSVPILVTKMDVDEL